MFDLNVYFPSPEMTNTPNFEMCFTFIEKKSVMKMVYTQYAFTQKGTKDTSSYHFSLVNNIKNRTWLDLETIWTRIPPQKNASSNIIREYFLSKYNTIWMVKKKGNKTKVVLWFLKYIYYLLHKYKSLNVAHFMCALFTPFCG